MLSILCVTRLDKRVKDLVQSMLSLAGHLNAELVIAHDSPDPLWCLPSFITNFGLHRVSIRPVCTNGCIESVLDNAVTFCHGDYVLRLDDDEEASPAMIRWLKEGFYTKAPVWSFPRASLWESTATRIDNSPLWTDDQTRLTLKEHAGGRKEVHADCPAGHGRMAPAMIYHHKFLLFSYNERYDQAVRYEALQEGAGTGDMLPFQLPETLGQLTLQPVGDGSWHGKSRWGTEPHG